MRAFHKLLATAMVSLAASAATLGGVDVDFGATVRLGDRDDVFVAVSAHYFDRDPELVRRCAGDAASPDDLAVALFIARHSRHSVDAVIAARGDSGSWWEVALRFGVPVDVWFVPVERAPGPPYGKAYGHWKKHRRDPKRAIVLSDREVRDLVAVRVIHEYYGVPVELAMEWRSTRRDLRSILTDEYERRHGAREEARAASGNGSTGRKHGSGKPKQR